MQRLALLLSGLLTLPALADGRARAVPLLPQYKAECGSCHVAFPPALLSKADWRKTLAGLDRHFGTDASLDAASRAILQPYLEGRAGPRLAPGAAAEPRMTTTAWFKREHGEVPARVWNDARIKSAANCAACHQGAEQGRYDEAEIVLPGQARHNERS
jgi:hypothetical protein